MKNVAIGVVEPIYEVNLGHIARVMKNFGVEPLLLVNSRVNLKEARKFASHGYDILEKARELDFDDLIHNFELAVGTTAITSARSSNILRNVITPEELRGYLERFSGEVCILFGRESTGLKNKELDVCDLVVSIPTGTDYPTLNIAHSVAILLYELSKAKVALSKSTASKEDRVRTVQYATKLATMSGFSRHKMPLLVKGLTRILGKGRPTSRELYLLMGLLRKATISLELLRSKSAKS